VVCYFKNTGDGKYLVQDINPSLCTHIIYAFSILDPATHLMISSNTMFDVEQENFKLFIELKNANPKAKFMIAFGGATNSMISGNFFNKPCTFGGGHPGLNQ
jgi:chitinase